MSEALKRFERLPQCILPKHYAITLKPDLNKFESDGKCKIRVQIVQTTDRVVLNALDIKVTKAYFKQNENVYEAAKIEVKNSEEIVIISFRKTLPVGVGEFYIEFMGELNDNMKGFYRNKYTTAEGETRYAAVTQFEPTDARRAFPCWDEPAIKATFDIKLIVPKDRVAISNMNVISEIPSGDFREVTFATTPIMSTYLVAAVIGEYDFIEGLATDGVKVRVYTPRGKQEQGSFALEVAVRALSFFKSYFGIAYPLPKMDLIAIENLAFQAMENWGLVTYREADLLVDPQNASANHKQWISVIVAHELAHMWFGNLVTMEWWTDLWLNEGFATFMQFHCVDNLFPEFDIWAHFVANIYSLAINLDALTNSHPIEITVGHPSEIDEIFDDISYKKGASVIRMVHSIIGDDCFKQGLHNYLTKYGYKNSVTNDLWKCFEEVSQKPIEAIMSTWTRQKGFPVLTVASSQVGTNRVLTVTQDKFNADGQTDVEQTWIIPIDISTAANPNQSATQMLMDNKTTQITIEGVGANDWVKLNRSTVGFYHVLYTEEAMSRFKSCLEDGSLPQLDRIGLVSDLFALVQAGRASSVDILELIEACRGESNYAVWCSVDICLAKLNSLLTYTDFQSKFESFCRSILQNVHGKLGWDAVQGESHSDTLLRVLVLSRLVGSNDEKVIAEAEKRFKCHIDGSCVLQADIVEPVYCAVVGNGDEDTFDRMIKLYIDSAKIEDKERISKALCCVTNPKLLKKLLEFAFSDKVRLQNTLIFIKNVATTDAGRDTAWSFFQEKKNEIRERYKTGWLISRLVKSVTENFASEEKALEIEEFFANNHFLSTERTVQQSLESIRMNANWLKRDQEDIRKFLKK